MIYLFLLFLVFMNGMISYNQSTLNKNKLFLSVTALPLVFVAGFRNLTVGIDTASYIQIFNSVKASTFMDLINGTFYEYRSIEIGYLFWNKIISIFSDSPQFMIFCNSFLFIMLINTFIKKSSINIFLTLFLFVTGGTYILFFNLMRQMIAVAFIANSFMFYKEKKKFLCILFFIIAFSFHVISLVGIVIFILYKIKFSKIKMTFTLVSLLFIGSNYMFFLNLIVKILPRFAKYLNNIGIVNPIGGVVIFYLIDLLLIIYTIYIAKWDNKTKEPYFLALMTSIYLFFMFLGSQFNFLDRVGLIFKPFEIVFIPLALSKISGKYKNLTTIGLIILLIVYFIFSTIFSNQYQYIFFWKG